MDTWYINSTQCQCTTALHCHCQFFIFYFCVFCFEEISQNRKQAELFTWSKKKSCQNTACKGQKYPFYKLWQIKKTDLTVVLWYI